jgi:3-oxoadipate enol-lactonase
MTSATSPAAAGSGDDPHERTVPIDPHGSPVRLACTDRGEGPLAVFAHGLTSSRAVDSSMGFLHLNEVVDAGRRLLSYDARGHGRSTGTAEPGDYTWPGLAEDLLALLDAVAPPGPVSGIGSSMGTGTLLHAVVGSPGRFDRLVLTAPPTAWETRAAQAAGYLAAADFVQANGSGAFVELARQAPVPPAFAGLAAYPPVPDVTDALLPVALRGAAASDLPDPGALRGVTAPTLVLAWSDDPGHPVSTAELLVALLPDAQLRVAHTTADLLGWGGEVAEFLRP